MLRLLKWPHFKEVVVAIIRSIKVANKMFNNKTILTEDLRRNKIELSNRNFKINKWTKCNRYNMLPKRHMRLLGIIQLVTLKTCPAIVTMLHKILINWINHIINNNNWLKKDSREHKKLAKSQQKSPVKVVKSFCHLDLALKWCQIKLKFRKVVAAIIQSMVKIFNNNP